MGLPLCDFCRMEDRNIKAEYDFKTRIGPWANGCEPHYQMYCASTKLGTGLGQLLVDSHTVREEMKDSSGEWVEVR